MQTFHADNLNSIDVEITTFCIRRRLYSTSYRTFYATSITTIPWSLCKSYSKFIRTILYDAIAEWRNGMMLNANSSQLAIAVNILMYPTINYEQRWSSVVSCENSICRIHRQN